MSAAWRVTFLGTGTSYGVPMIGCRCPTCTSADARDQRLRSAIRVEAGDLSLVVDTPPDFRTQCLRHGVARLDAVFLTHLHADHVLGMDDVRAFNIAQGADVKVFLPAHMQPRFMEIFGYCFRPAPAGLTRPRLDLRPIGAQPLTLGDLEVTPVPILHGDEPIYGYRFARGGRRLAYLTDLKELPPASVPLVEDLDLLILGALWRNPQRHPGHLNVDEAIALARRLRARAVCLTHLTHHVGPHADAAAGLPSGIEIAYDGLRLQV